MPSRALGWLVILVSLAGLLRLSSVHLWKEGSLRGVPTTRVDARYAALLADRPPIGERLCFRTDERNGEWAGRRYFEALYALAPRTLAVEDARAKRCVADRGGRISLEPK